MLTLKTWEVIAGPPGSPKTMDSVESEESLKRLATVKPKEPKN